jgi:hypothetical protein
MSLSPSFSTVSCQRPECSWPRWNSTKALRVGFAAGQWRYCSVAPSCEEKERSAGCDAGTSCGVASIKDDSVRTMSRLPPRASDLCHGERSASGCRRLDDLFALPGAFALFGSDRGGAIWRSRYAMATQLTNPEDAPEHFAGKARGEKQMRQGVTDAVNSALVRPLHMGISSRTNAMVDYTVAFLLFLGPVVSTFNDPAVPHFLRALGTMLIFYSLATKYELGLVRFIPLQVHLFLDLGMAVLLGAAPIHFNVTGIPGFVMVSLGAVMLANSLLTRHGQKFTRPHASPEFSEIREKKDQTRL